MKFIFALAVLVLAIATAEGRVCPGNYCDSVDCSGVVSQWVCEENDGVYKLKATICGCCPACLKKVFRGDVCYHRFERGFPPSWACESGTTCQHDGSKWVCVESNIGNPEVR